MRKPPFHFELASIDAEKKMLWIVDMDGPCSVTNAAEDVCAVLNSMHPEYRIIYRDTDGNWDELVHHNGVFSDFKPARDLGLP